MIRALTKAGGKLAAEDDKTYKEIVKALISDWKIDKVPEIMMVNRMVSTWMKMRRVEELMLDYDLFYEKRDNDGNLIGVNMNQLAFYLKSLESDFRNYYKALTSGKSVNTEEKTDFHDFIKEVKVVDDDKKTRPKKDKVGNAKN